MVMTDKFQRMRVETFINSSKAFHGKEVDNIKNLSGQLVWTLRFCPLIA